MISHSASVLGCLFISVFDLYSGEILKIKRIKRNFTFALYRRKLYGNKKKFLVLVRIYECLVTSICSKFPSHHINNSDVASFSAKLPNPSLALGVIQNKCPLSPSYCKNLQKLQSFYFYGCKSFMVLVFYYNNTFDY